MEPRLILKSHTQRSLEFPAMTIFCIREVENKATLGREKNGQWTEIGNAMTRRIFAWFEEDRHHSTALRENATTASIIGSFRRFALCGPRDRH